MKLVPSNNFSKKLHYILKYLVLALPMLLLLISCLIPKKQITNNYSVDSTTQINYKYQTNEVNSVDDLIVGNIYEWDLSNNIAISCYYISFDYYLDENYINFNFDGLSNSSYLFLSCSNNENLFYVRYYVNNEFQTSNSFILSNISNLCFVFKSGDFTSNIIKCSLELIPIENTTIINTINENSSLISSNEGRTYNDEIISPIMSFYEMPLNNFYFDLLDTIGIVYTNEIVKYLLCYVLWIMYVYLFDLIADIFAFIPKILHNLAYKIGGDD